MTKPHPLSSTCTATCKATGERCKKKVVGGGVCPSHGGAAPQVRVKREARVAVGMLELEARAQHPDRRTPAELLLDAAQTTGAVVSKLKADLAAGRVEPGALEALGPWLDRLQRTSQAVISSKADELLIRQAERVDRAQASVMVTAVAAALEFLDLTPEQERQVPGAVRAALASVNAAEAEPLPGEVIGRE